MLLAARGVAEADWHHRIHSSRPFLAVGTVRSGDSRGASARPNEVARQIASPQLGVPARI